MDLFAFVGLFWILGRITAAAFATRSANNTRIGLRQFRKEAGSTLTSITNSLISLEAAMTRCFLATAIAIVATSGCAYAQVGGMGMASPNSGMGMTSPLGMGTSGACLHQREFLWGQPHSQRRV